MDKIKILVVCHKAAEVFHDDVYTPIQVGKALHPDLNLGYLTDNTGDNISSKNGFYSELTAQYWAWKNLHDTEYVGLCHYRRYFNHRISSDNIDKILGNKADILLIDPITEWMNLGERLIAWTSREDFYIFYKCFEKVHPEDIRQFRLHLNQNRFTPYNMFVLKKNAFDEFAEWQFAIFAEMEKYVRPSSYSRQKRLYGYLSEILLSLFAKIKGFHVRYDRMCSYNEKFSYLQDIHYHLARCKGGLFNDISFRLSHGMRIKHKLFSGDFNAVEAGMKQDGIEIK